MHINSYNVVIPIFHKERQMFNFWKHTEML